MTEAVQIGQVEKEQAAAQADAVEPGQDAAQQQCQPAETKGGGHVLAGQRIAADPGDGHHDDGDGGDQLGLHRGLTDDQRADDGDGVPHRVRQAQPGLLQQGKGKQHTQHLQCRGEGHVLLGLNDGQQQPRGDHLRVKTCHRHIERRREQAQQQRGIAQQGEGGGGAEVDARVVRYRHEGGKIRRQQQTHRQPVHQQTDPPVQQMHGKAVRPLGVQHLREGGKRRVGEPLLQNAAAQQRLRVQMDEPLANPLDQLRRGDPFHI